MQYDKQIDAISNLGKQKKFSKKIELEPQDYETLTKYAKKGIVADKEIYERDTRIENLRNTLSRWIEKYDGTRKSLVNKSRRPHSHPNQHTDAEILMIKKYKSQNKDVRISRTVGKANEKWIYKKYNKFI